ncbi:hypothetical protein P0136_10240 [Lentisphaerota bacterium ZTH]|nr:hypothetical protein JYG24_12250 [Lentisphaerota bacterium]WET05739.1 hypothetical protein P0136_10240 [Lentisphaerota bacterium ZTH]
MKFFSALLLIGTCLVAQADKTQNIYIAKDLGISMEVPAATGSTDKINTVIASFGLPFSGDFQPSINIIKQKFSGTLADYDKLSRNQFKTMQWAVLSSRKIDGGLVYEYTGKLRKKYFHFYAKALKKDNCIYLATATSLKSQWAQFKEKLIKSVNSFKLIKN